MDPITAGTLALGTLAGAGAAMASGGGGGASPALPDMPKPLSPGRAPEGSKPQGKKQPSFFAGASFLPQAQTGASNPLGNPMGGKSLLGV